MVNECIPRSKYYSPRLRNLSIRSTRATPQENVLRIVKFPRCAQYFRLFVSVSERAGETFLEPFRTQACGVGARDVVKGAGTVVSLNPMLKVRLGRATRVKKKKKTPMEVHGAMHSPGEGRRGEGQRGGGGEVLTEGSMRRSAIVAAALGSVSVILIQLMAFVNT